MALEFEGKVAIVTGGSRGIGAAIVSKLAREGASVIIADVSPPSQETPRAQYIRTDVGKRDQVEAMFSRTLAELGRVDILVNNAAATVRKPMLDLEVADVAKTWDVIQWGTFHCSQLAARAMVKSGEGGSIIVISSVQAERPSALSTAYNGAKAAVNHMALTWAGELVKHRIRVNVIEPGWIDTPGEHILYTEEQLEEGARMLPMGRLGRPEEIAEAVAFVASGRASYMTGSILRVDGGILLPV
ncbi:MAG: SDR family oxidoreductase [Bryobacterales bacterium]|nr:SDR family oxidoreductase [Bryobacterales bacterium]